MKAIPDKIYDEVKIGDRFINFMGNELRIMAKVEKYWVIEYKGYEPFVKHEKEMNDFLILIQAKPFMNKDKQ